MPAYTTETSDTGGRRQTVAFFVFLVLAFVANYLPGEAQQEVASALRASVLRPFVLTQEGLAEAKVRAAESSRLREELDSLVALTTARNTLEEENLRLRGLLSISERIGPGYVAAAVVRPGTAGSESTFLVDVGAEQGIAAPAPVITRHGLVGVVRDVQRGNALGIDWTHPDFRASAVTLDGTTSGIVESHRGDFREEDRLVFNGTPFHTTLEEGTVVVTSGLGAVYPRGIPIGRVRGLAEADAGWRKSYWLEAFADPGNATHVLVAAREGEGIAPVSDLRAAWPEDSIVTDERLAATERARHEALAAVADSMEILRAIFSAQRTQDSLRQAVLGDTAAPGPAVPAPPATRVGEGEGAGPDEAAEGPRRPAPQPTLSRLRPPTDTVRIGGARPPADTGGATRPDTARPDTALPDTVPPAAAPPDTVRPDTVRPDTTRRIRPDTNRARPPGGGG